MIDIYRILSSTTYTLCYRPELRWRHQVGDLKSPSIFVYKQVTTTTFSSSELKLLNMPDTPAAKSSLIDVQQLPIKCKGCGSNVSTKIATCPQCKGGYHPSCALVTGTTSTGAFNKCCGRKANSPAPISLDNVKNVVLLELRSELSNMISNAVKDTISESLKTSINKEISECLGTAVRDNIQPAMDDLQKDLDTRLTGIRTSFEEFAKSTNARMKTMEDDLFIAREEITRINARIDTFNKDLSVAKISARDTGNAVSQNQVLEEIEDRLLRRKNVILYGIPENDNNLNADKDNVNSALSDLGFDSSSITGAIRLGKFSTSLGKPRPIKITTASVEHVDKLIRSFQQMKKTDSLPPCWVNVQIQRDWTLKQRQDYAELKKELTARKTQGEDQARIVTRNGVSRIVNPRPAA